MSHTFGSDLRDTARSTNEGVTTRQIALHFYKFPTGSLRMLLKCQLYIFRPVVAHAKHYNICKNKFKYSVPYGCDLRHKYITSRTFRPETM